MIRSAWRPTGSYGRYAGDGAPMAASRSDGAFATVVRADRSPTNTRLTLVRRLSRPPGAVELLFQPRVHITRRRALADWRTLEPKLPFTFKNRDLLRQALIHTSYLNENPGIGIGSNERLEFLGDAALGIVVAHQLYTEYPDVDEGKLTELRAHLVRRDTLARAATALELGDALQLGRGEDAAGGRKRPTNLARVYEALVGAIFLDGGFARVRSFVRQSLKDEFTALRQRGMPYDPKSRLQ